MQNERFFDQNLLMLEKGEVAAALAMLAGNLHHAIADQQNWEQTRAQLHNHRLYSVIMEDPYTRRSASQPRGYAGDAGLIDIIYDRRHSDSASEIGEAMFRYSINFPASEAVRLRKNYAAELVEQAWRSGKKVLVLACGHFREADGLIGEDLTKFTLVDQDALSLDRVKASHSTRVHLQEANVFRFMREAASDGETFDLIYTLGLTDYLDSRTMQLLHKLMKQCLAPGGTILLANFLPHHLATGWMDALMNWQLIYRDEAELAKFAREIDTVPECWRDPTDTIAWCQMSARS